jgi:molybdopterin-guanine dinucleotide biosynthesis protein A
MSVAAGGGKGEESKPLCAVIRTALKEAVKRFAQERLYIAKARLDRVFCGVGE